MTAMATFISAAADNHGWHYQELRGGWMHRLHNEYAVRYVMGYTFPHNSAVAAKIACDKVATYLVLDQAKISSVQHFLVKTKGLDATEAHRICRVALTSCGLPEAHVVVKPVAGSNGMGVHVATTMQQGLHALNRILAADDGLAAISPYLVVEREIRAIILDGQPLLLFEKLRANDWRHNLALGARPNLLLPSSNTPLIGLAGAATRALGLRLAAVDIIEMPSGRFAVLEVNEAIKLDTFASHGAIYSDLAASVYDQIVATI